MSVIRLQEMTPQIYTEESRDFQLLSRLYDSVFNGLKFDTDSILDLIDTKECRTSVLQLLQTKLGFFTERKIDDEKLRSILECFPILVRNKGSLRAIKETLYLFLRMYSVSSNMEIYYLPTPYSPPFSEEEPCVLASGKLPENNSLVIRIHSFETKPDTSVMEEIFKYILPAGINYYIEFDKGATLQDIVLKSEDSAELTFVSDNINSQLRSSDQTEPYNIGTVNTSSLISTDSYVSNRFIGYYGDEQSASDYLATLVDKIYSTAVINYSATGEVSGPIVSISDAEAGAPVEALSIEVEPIQDLHGYDAPWPAGGGKNKLPPHAVGSLETGGVTFTFNADETITITGTPTANFSYGGIYGANSVDLSVLKPLLNGITAGGNLSITINGNSTGIELLCQFNKADGTLTTSRITSSKLATTVPSDAVYMYVAIKITKAYVTAPINATVKLLVGNSANTEDWTPFSNICPISGWTGVTVTRTGKNLFPDAGDITVLSNKTFKYNSPIILKGQTVTLSFSDITYSGGFTSSVVFFLRLNSSGIRNLSFNTSTKSKTWTATEDVYGINFYATSSGSTNPGVTTVYHDAQIEIGSTTTDYEPYQEETLDITFPNEAGTVYGGTLDVLSGLLTGILGEVDLGTLSWNRVSYGTEYLFYANLIGGSQKDAFIGKCSSYKMTTDAAYTIDKTCRLYGSEEYGFSRVAIRDDTYTDAASFKAAMSGVQLVYELATPTTIQLTPQQVELLQGENNLWSDAGDISITYKRDGTYKAMICTAYSSNTPTWYRINFLGNLTTEEVSTQGGIVSALQAKGITVNNGDLIKYNNLYLLRVNNDWQECNYARYILNTYHLTE